MELFPAIDLLNGKAVRLLRGDYSKITAYSDNPPELAQSFRIDGAKNLHVVDLDGAKEGGTPNFQIITDIAKRSGLFVEVGGGIRSMETVKRYLDAGVGRVILGTAAVTDPEFLRAAVSEYGDKIAVGVDVNGEYVAIKGWTETSKKHILDMCRELQELGVKTIICTDISKDGAMQGVNLGLYKRLMGSFSMDVIASGGVTTLQDIELLKASGVAGAILGKSLYEGSINLKDALALAGERV